MISAKLMRNDFGDKICCNISPMKYHVTQKVCVSILKTDKIITNKEKNSHTGENFISCKLDLTEYFTLVSKMMNFTSGELKFLAFGRKLDLNQ